MTPDPNLLWVDVQESEHDNLLRASRAVIDALNAQSIKLEVGINAHLLVLAETLAVVLAANKIPVSGVEEALQHEFEILCHNVRYYLAWVDLDQVKKFEGGRP